MYYRWVFIMVNFLDEMAVPFLWPNDDGSKCVRGTIEGNSKACLKVLICSKFDNAKRRLTLSV